MRKFLRKKFGSHGTPLGYLGSLSQKGRPEIFSKWVLINFSNPLRHPEPLVDPLLTKNLAAAGPWCALLGNIKIEQATLFCQFWKMTHKTWKLANVFTGTGLDEDIDTGSGLRPVWSSGVKRTRSAYPARRIRQPPPSTKSANGEDLDHVFLRYAHKLDLSI